ncbi:MAG: TIGR03915 family putative DNA repair protein [Treponema sp.]|jgi:probable DNA metabolism protein|nr:TIGR03915 family putative DNA repair protein [Treponema sp.]
MTEVVYDGSLEGIFVVLDGVCRGAPLPDRIRPVSGGYSPALTSPELDASGYRNDPAQEDLFGTEDAGKMYPPKGERAGVFSGSAECRPSGSGAVKELFSVSANAFDSFIYGWMSEFPIAADLVRFAWKVIAAARAGGRGRPGDTRSPEARLAAGRAAADRGDPAVAATLAAAFKVCREIDRLRGLLRFAPDSLGVYTARCAPDHFVLPDLAEHFFLRFGDTPWAIMDEKRQLALVCPADGEPRLVRAAVPRYSAATLMGPARTETPAFQAGADSTGEIPAADSWGELWRKYHRSVNNESRRNPALQGHFMPVRYRKYLNEL